MLSASAQEALEILSRSEYCTIDVETSGLDWRRNYIIGYVLCFDARTSIYVPVRHNGGANECNFPGVGEAEHVGPLPEHPFETAIRPLLAKPRHWVGHNLSFDLGFLFRHNLHLDGTFEDTMINAPLINEHLGNYPLDLCVLRANSNGADIPLKDQDKLIAHIQHLLGGPKSKSRMGDLWRLPGDDPVAVDYAVGDGLSTHGLRDWQQAELDRQDLRFVWKLECDLIPVLHRMSSRGIPIDMDRLEQSIERMRKVARIASKKLPPDLNTRSNKQMQSVFTEEEIARAPRTAPSVRFPNGQPSFKEEFLLTTEIGRNIVASRKANNMLSSFLVPLRDVHSVNGRINPAFAQMRGERHGTITGRLSAQRPNTQAIHKRNVEMGMILRRLFVALMGRRWKSVDYSQIEPRLLAHYSGARVLVEGYRAVPSVDAHTAVAKAANVDRQKGKTINQLLLTGGGVGALAAQLGCTRTEAQGLFDQYFKAMPEVRRLQKESAHTFRARGYVKTIMGRRCRLERADLDYKAINRLLQGGNADIMKRSLVQIDALLRNEPDLVMTNTVHDSIDFDCEPSERGEKLYREALDIMRAYGPDSEFPISVPIEVEDDEGSDWAEATYGVEKVRLFFEALAKSDAELFASDDADDLPDVEIGPETEIEDVLRAEGFEI